jgi:hypothetical protein
MRRIVAGKRRRIDTSPSPCQRVPTSREGNEKNVWHRSERDGDDKKGNRSREEEKDRKIERGQDGVVSILQDASEGTPDASQDKCRRE